MTNIRAFPAVAVLLSSTACFSPEMPMVSSSTDGSSGDSTADVSASSDAEGPDGSTSGDVEPTDSATTSDGSTGSETTGDPECSPGVFDASVFGQACFQ